MAVGGDHIPGTAGRQGSPGSDSGGEPPTSGARAADAGGGTEGGSRFDVRLNLDNLQEKAGKKTKLIDLVNQPTSGFTIAGNASLPPYANGKDNLAKEIEKMV